MPNEEALSADRVALIRDALVTHRAKRRLLDTLDGEDRSLLEALAFSALFFPSAGPDVLDAGAGARRPDATAPTQAPKAAESGTRDPRP
ncbi:hypothetical protein [Roseospira visakhapatnamensis]|uniref:Uncharacterized protein n=1 Tax=Roseospira visakhapatnamensis TaxID=390880 RepID=A0A7W6W9P0_9PROT|nr:hypothetical protein [Roseospira visakhapatnamensis]MBB4265998.1 hypothetical protein [Roseospira visakhapatnamensis]